MKNTKIKILFCSLLLASTLGLTACKEKTSDNEANTTTSETTTSETTTTQSEVAETAETTASVTENTEENSAEDLASLVLENGSFPMMQQYTTREEMEQYAAITVPENTEFAYYCQMMSVHLAEVLIIIADEGNIDDAYAVAEARGEKLINDMAFYPNQQAAAEATVYGKRGNVAYVICADDAKDAEAALLDIIG